MAARPEHVKTAVRFWEFWATMAAVRVEHPGLKYWKSEIAGKLCLPVLDTITRKTMIEVSTIRNMIIATKSARNHFFWKSLLKLAAG
ncbi:MAG TPA: hypothetical protein VF944_07015 [Candidatus Bathyarchaeia archaeon]